jgi:hypothetical protein
VTAYAEVEQPQAEQGLGGFFASLFSQTAPDPARERND